jgi:hypothetical protein
MEDVAVAGAPAIPSIKDVARHAGVITPVEDDPLLTELLRRGTPVVLVDRAATPEAA